MGNRGYYVNVYLDLPNACQMVPKGCQFTIPKDSIGIGTPWKVLVSLQIYKYILYISEIEAVFKVV